MDKDQEMARYRTKSKILNR